MIRLEKLKKRELPSHVALILDGNGRWAKRRGRNRQYGHRQGALNVKTIAIEANRIGIEVLSVYAFSTENWKRPQKEIDFLMKMPKSFEEESSDDVHDSDIRIVFSGRRDRIDHYNRGLMEKLEERTKENGGMILNICFDYGSRDEIVNVVKRVAKKVKKGSLSIDAIDESTVEEHLYTKGLPSVDLMIRTSGEQRLSNDLLWQNAYAEFWFTKRPWPAFKEKHLRKAVYDYQNRNRRFGGLKG